MVNADRQHDAEQIAMSIVDADDHKQDAEMAQLWKRSKDAAVRRDALDFQGNVIKLQGTQPTNQWSRRQSR
jgi:hypothetical protein